MPTKKDLRDAIAAKLDERVLEILDNTEVELDAALISAISKRLVDLGKGEKAESPELEQERAFRSVVKPKLKMAGA